MGKTDDSAATGSSSGEFADLKTWMKSELKEMKESLSKEISDRSSKQDDKLDEISGQLDVLEGETFATRDLCDDLTRKNNDLTKEVTELRSQVQQLEAYTRRENLRFYNIADHVVEDTEDILRAFIYEKLRLNPDVINFSIVHRLGPYKAGQSRCIIARFVRRIDADRVKAAAVKLKGTKFGVSEDLPAAWVATRRSAFERYVRPARADKKRVRWRGKRLFIAGEEINLENTRNRIDQVRVQTQEAEPENNTNENGSASDLTPTQSREDNRNNGEEELGADKQSTREDTTSGETLSPTATGLPLPQRRASARLTRLDQFRFGNTPPNSTRGGRSSNSKR